VSESVGKRVREARQAKGLSQTELARDLMSPSYVSLIEAGKRFPEPDVLAALAKRLGTTADYLSSGIDPGVGRAEHLSLRYAELALANGQPDEAAKEFRQLSQSRDPATRFAASWGLARALEALGFLEQAIAQVHALLEQSRPPSVPDPGPLTLWITLVRLYREVGDINQSIDLGEKGLREAQSLGLTGTEAEVELTVTLVGSYYERGDYSRAALLAKTVIEAAERHGSYKARASAYWNASLVAEARDDVPLALDLAERALALLSESDDERSLARLRVAYAWLLLRQPEPEPERTLALLRKAHAALRDRGSAVDLAYCETELARCHAFVGDAPSAIEFAKSALRRLGEKDVIETARARLVLGQALVLSGDSDAGWAECELAAHQLTGLHAPRQAASAWREVAEMAAQMGRLDRALDAFRRLADAVGARAVPSALSAGRLLTTPPESRMLPRGQRPEAAE
jgi:transcriptional regulator with XRE-family HTH domain